MHSREKEKKEKTQGTVYLKCTGRFKPSVPHIKQPRHTNTNGSLMEEKKIFGRDSKEPHTDVTVPTFSQLCRGRYRARREEEREKREEKQKIPETERKQVRQRSMVMWQQTKPKRKKKDERKERKQRPSMVRKPSCLRRPPPAGCLHRPPVKHSLSSSARFYWPCKHC